MRTFIITDADGTKRLVQTSFYHPCDDPPPRVVLPEVRDITKLEMPIIHPAVIEDPAPLYDGPRENVVEIKDDQAGAKAMREFTGAAEIERRHPELFRTPKAKRNP